MELRFFDQGSRGAQYLFMPKEGTHWLVAERLGAVLEGSVAGASAANYPHIRAFGAIYPDIIFYLPDDGTELTLAHRYHGEGGEDTYDLVRRAVSFIAEPAHPNPWWSFVVGLVSHIVADQTFHPLVYYLTGNDEAQDMNLRIRAIAAHRKWEALMDLFFVGRGSMRKNGYRTWWHHWNCPYLRS